VAAAVVGEQLRQGAVARVDEGVVREQPLWLDPVRGIEGETLLEEAGDRRRPLVAVELALGQPRMIVDERVHPLVSDPQPLLGTPVRCRSPVTA